MTSQKHAALVTALCIILALMAGMLYLWRAAGDPSSTLLLSEGGARWIRVNEPAIPFVRKVDPLRAFRTVINIDKTPARALLTFKAMRDAEVLVDEQLVRAVDEDLDDWREPVEVDLAPYLSPGAHTLGFTVKNRNGPALLLAYSEALGVHTGPDWETSNDGVNWTGALAASQPMSLPLSRNYPVARAFVSCLPVLLPVFFITFFWTLAYYREGGGNGWIARITPGAGTLRWLIIAALAVLGANNFFQVPISTGFDSSAHLDYIRFVAERFSIPYANDGWQMFQSPLYYMVSAPFYLMLKPLLATSNLVRALKLIPFALGIAQVEITYRMLKKVLPGRPDILSLGVVIGGLLPATLYSSLSLGNEPMCGAFSAAALAVAFWILVEPAPPSRGRLLLLGAFLGLALLSKFTAVLLIPPLGFLLIYKARENGGKVGALFTPALTALGTAFAISSWYYIRNWIKLGKPFVGGWDPSRQIVWWQDPGYRTLGDLYRFGESLVHPLYSSFNGFWDSFYSTLWLDGMVSGIWDVRGFPPWNFNIMVSGSWLALLPTVAIIIAVAASLLRPMESFRKGPLFAVICLAIYLAALAHLYLNIPIYTTLKATYTTGLTPVYALLAATGLGMLMRTTLARAAVYGWVACWAAFAYLSYFAA
ncbi:MAG: hypothetical protein Q8P48_08695 [Deltaproteobacteria bacterium]|nr:hypothetical protein [Deltaproteobacteria bacterium]